MVGQPTSVSQLIRYGESFLTSHGVPNALRNAEWLLAHVLDFRSADLYLDGSYSPAQTQIDAFQRLLDRRGAREPLQYILGTTEFMSLQFYSPPGVFIPRPDTEALVERIERHLQDNGDGGRRLIADLCCGSGVIGISVVKRVANTTARAVDLSQAAVDLTARNAALNGVRDRVECIHGDAIEYVGQVGDRFDVVACNPPYIPTDDIQNLAPEIREHEPKLGLDGGGTGLDFYCAIAGVLRRSLKSGGLLAFEIGSDQAERVADILADRGFVEIEVHPDYAGLDRVVIARSV